jgi:hypothetical protein
MKSLNKSTSKQELFNNYYSNTGLVLIDELHHLSAKSYLDLLDNYLTSYDYIYGVSGSIDAKDGKLPKLSDNPNKLSGDLNRIISYTSFPRLDIKNETNLIISKFNINCKKIPEALKFNYPIAIKWLMNSYDLIPKLVTFLRKFHDRRIFFPVFSKEQGKLFTDKLIAKLGEGSTIFISSSGCYPPLPDGYKDFKDYMSRSDKFRVIVGTTSIYEGMDSDRINTVFVGVGNNQRMTIQPTGRGTRSSDTPLVLLPWDESGNNVIMNKQTNSKLNKLKTEYVNHKIVNIN